MARDCGEVIFDGSELLCCLRLRMKMPRLFGPRMTVAMWLFQLAGLVSGLNVVVEVDDELTDQVGA